MESDTQSSHHGSERLRPILPAEGREPPIIFDDASSHPQDEQIKATKAACSACRKRKSKCSGARPNCAMCVSRGSDCVYDTAMSNKTHGQALKRKYDLLKESNTVYKEIFKFLQVQSETEAEKLFRHIRSGIDAVFLFTQITEANALPTPNKRLQPGLPSIAEMTASMRHHDNPYPHSTLSPWSDKSHKDDLKGPDEDFGHSAGPSQTTNPQLGSCGQPSTTKNEGSIGLACFDQLLSWKTTSIFKNSDLIDGDQDQSTILSLPPLPLDAYTSYSHPDVWTQTGWTKSHMLHLFDVLFTWDYLPYSLICYELFLKDFQSGSPRFCSSALVHAILALSVRIVNENDDNSNILLSGWLRSRVLFDEAKAQVRNSGPLKNLPDIQALGLLSLYEIRCGQEEKAQELVESFVYNITELDQRQPPAGKEVEQDEQYARVKATAYCGAVSLARILLLTTGGLSTGGYHTLQADLSILDQLSQSREDTSQSSRWFGSHLGIKSAFSELLNLQVISAKIFQLTEWAYKFASLSQSDSQRAASDLESFYIKCLDWYEHFFTLLDNDGSRTPFILFVHMYYHFCILCVFRPFSYLPRRDSSMQPRKICRQAAQSILALAQSYDDLFTLRRVSGIIPYFIYASGLFCIATEGGSSQMAPVHLRLSHHMPGTEPDLDTHTSAVRHYDSLATSPYFKVSAIVHARRLLAKIGSTHPPAVIAGEKL